MNPRLSFHPSILHRTGLEPSSSTPSRQKVGTERGKEREELEETLGKPRKTPHFSNANPRHPGSGT